MINQEALQQFNTEIEQELIGHILPFWMEKTVDHKHGGFYGQMDNDNRIHPNAKKCGILYSRILWTFASAYRLFGNESYLATAKRAFDYLNQYFWDGQYSGLFFMVNSRGRVVDPRKLVYNLSFGIYGFSEYYRATGDQDALDRAIRLYRLIEQYCHDDRNRGYFEACSRDWQLIGNMHLTRKRLHEKKSMNTHLHLLESYTNLLRVWDDVQLRQSIYELVDLLDNSIIDAATGHFLPFFDEAWNAKLGTASFGHDIEGSWLLYETAMVLSDEPLKKRVKTRTLEMVESIYREGLDPQYGGLFYERENGELNPKKVWWVQCEAMVGFFNALELTGEDRFWDAVTAIWSFTKHYLINHSHGEWFYEVSREGKPNEQYYKVGPWKCPYHNGRACMELISRIRNYTEKDKQSQD
jgi:mannobiose 2-epimerase